MRHVFIRAACQGRNHYYYCIYLCLFKTPIVLNCTVCAADMNDTSKIVQLAEKCAILRNKTYDFHLEDDKTRGKKSLDLH